MLNIGGFLPLSLIDFPGTPSAVVFTNGCQLRCPFCHNPDLAKGIAPNIPEDYVKDELRKLQGKVQGVVISGGEPTLQPDLWEFCKWCKDEGFKVKLDTNGKHINSAVLEIVDYVALDLKHLFAISPNCMPVSFLTFNLLASQIRYDQMGEVRITCVEPFIDEISLASFIEYFYHEEDIDFPIYLQHCNVTPQILDPDFFASGKGRAWTQDEINSFVEKYGKKYNVKAR